MKYSTLSILFFLVSLAVFGNTHRCNKYIDIANLENTLLVKDEVCYGSKNESIISYSKKGHPNFNFRDSVVFYINLVSQEEAAVFIEIGNPHLQSVRLIMGNANIYSNKYIKDNYTKGRLSIKKHRNFRFEVNLTADTTELMIVTKTHHFWQPMPIIIYKPNYVRKFTSREGFLLGNLMGLFIAIVLISLVLILAIRDDKIILFSAFTIVNILFIIYELNTYYFIWDGLNSKVDMAAFLFLVNAQIISSQLFLFAFFRRFLKKNQISFVRKYISITIISRTIVFSIGIISLYSNNINLYKIIEFVQYFGNLIVGIVFTIYAVNIFDRMDKKSKLFAFSLYFFAAISYGYLFEKIGVLPYTYGWLSKFGIWLVPANSILPELYNISFLILLIVAITLIFTEYKRVKAKDILSPNSILELAKEIESERISISQDIHDGVGGNLSLISTRLNELMKKAGLNPEERNKIKKKLNQLVTDNRKTSREINPGSIGFSLLNEIYESEFFELDYDNDKVDYELQENISILSNILEDQKGQIYRFVSAMVPIESDLSVYKKIVLGVGESESTFELFTIHFLKSAKFNFEQVYNERLENKIAIIKAYGGGDPSFNKLSDLKYKITIQLPKENFFNKEK